MFWGTNLCLPFPWDRIDFDREGQEIGTKGAKPRTQVLKFLHEHYNFLPKGTDRNEFCDNPGRSTCFSDDQ